MMPNKRLSIDVREYFFCAPLLFIPAIVYSRYLAVSLVGGDGDCFLLQAYQNGIAYAGGYAVYLWVCKIFFWLLGGSLNSVSVVSFVFSLLALFGLYYFLYRMGVSAKAAVAALLLWSFTPVFWVNATRASIYNFNAFFLIVILFCFYAWSQTHRKSFLAAASLVYGLSLGVWFANILMVLPIVFFVIYEASQEKLQVVRLSALCIFFIAAGAIFPILYVYFRAQELPPIGAFYNPDNFGRLISYLFGFQFDLLGGTGPASLLERFYSQGRVVMNSFFTWGVVAALAGVVFGRRFKRSYAFFLGALFTFNFIGMTLVGQRKFHEKITLSYILIALFLAIGLDAVLSRWPRRFVQAALAVVFALTITAQLSIFPAQYNIQKVDDSILKDCQEVLSGLPENAVLFAKWSLYTSVLCLQTIKGQRRDVEIYQLDPSARTYKRGGVLQTIRARELIDRLRATRERPVFLTHLYLSEYYPVHQTGKFLFEVLPERS